MRETNQPLPLNESEYSREEVLEAVREPNYPVLLELIANVVVPSPEEVNLPESEYSPAVAAVREATGGFIPGDVGRLIPRRVDELSETYSNLDKIATMVPMDDEPPRHPPLRTW